MSLAGKHVAEQTLEACLDVLVPLLVAGQSERGTPTTLSRKPITPSLGKHAVVRGSQALPEGCKPRQTTAQVLDRVAGNALGMRVMPVMRVQ